MNDVKLRWTDWLKLPHPETTARDLSAIAAILESELPTNPDDTALVRRTLMSGAEGVSVSEAIHNNSHFKLGLLVEEARDRSLEALRECLLLETVTAVYVASRNSYSAPSARNVAAVEVEHLLQIAVDEAQKHFDSAVQNVKNFLAEIVNDLCQERAFTSSLESQK